MRKRTAAFLLALVLALGCLTGVRAAESEEEFVIDENGVLTKYNGSGGNVVIPDGVTSIGRDAFYGCSSLTRVTIPESVTSIGREAFSCCSRLTSVTIPESVAVIGGDAFSGCSSLTSVTIPESVTVIGDHAFSYCSSLTSVTLGRGLATVGSDAFGGCNGIQEVHFDGSMSEWLALPVWHGIFPGAHSLFIGGALVTDLNIPDSCTSIRDCAFFNCSSLISVTIPDSVVTIGNGAFCGCVNLAEAELPQGLTSISDYVFYGCDSLHSIEIPNGVTEIGTQAFQYSGLWSVSLPDSVTTVGRDAFSGCRSLSTASLGEGLTYLGDRAFWNCTLKSIRIPDGVTRLFAYTFSSCSTEYVSIGKGLSSLEGCPFESLDNVIAFDVDPENTVYRSEDGVLLEGSTVVRYPARSPAEHYEIPQGGTTIGYYAFQYCRNLKSVRIPEGVLQIGNHCFAESNIEAIIIPASVTQIGNGAFNECYRLKDVYYSGTQSQWDAINRGSGNDRLSSARIHFLGEPPASQRTPVVSTVTYTNTCPPKPNTVRVKFKGGIRRTGYTEPFMDIEWSFSDFVQDARRIDGDADRRLAIASLVLAANVYEEDLLDRTLEFMGFGNFWSDNYDGYDDINRVAFGIASKKTQIGGENTNVIAIACRGTATLLQDWGSNILQQSQGFRFAAEDLRSDLDWYISEYGIDTTLSTKFLITGHSRGAAVANILGTMLSDITPDQNVFVYTFACPNTTTEGNRTSYKNIHNIIVEGDPVPVVPPMFGGNNRFGSADRYRYYNTSRVPNFNTSFRLLTSLDEHVLRNVGWADAWDGNVHSDYPVGTRYHAPVTYMACLLGDEADEAWKMQAKHKIAGIHCPVDVAVYDADGTLLGSIVDNVPDESLYQYGIFVVVEGDEKYIYTTTEADLRFVLTGTDDGEMEFDLQEIDMTTGEVLTEKSFTGVGLTAGKTMVADIAGDIAAEDTQLLVETDGEITAEIDAAGNETEVVTLSFFTDLGDPVRDMAVPKGTAAGTLPVTQRPGYVFGGWYTDLFCKTAFDPETELNASLALYAKFTPSFEVYGYFSAVTYDGEALMATLAYDYNTRDSRLFVALYQEGKLIALGSAEAPAGSEALTVSMPVSNLYGVYELRAFSLDAAGTFLPLCDCARVSFIAN